MNGTVHLSSHKRMSCKCWLAFGLYLLQSKLQQQLHNSTANEQLLQGELESCKQLLTQAQEQQRELQAQLQQLQRQAEADAQQAKAAAEQAVLQLQKQLSSDASLQVTPDRQLSMLYALPQELCVQAAGHQSMCNLTIHTQPTLHQTTN
jgi:chromosome segregation ATPase